MLTADYKFEGWDFDGTICHSPKGMFLIIYRAIESICPFITIILPVKEKPINKDIIIITASSNKIGVASWLKLHKVSYHSILFVSKFKDKKYFIRKICKKYVETG